MGPTLVTILALLALATVIVVVRARRRDPCLRDFEAFHVTIAEKGGDLSWGKADVQPNGLEVTYVDPIVAREGHQERSFIFYKEQYGAMEALYRYARGLTDEERRRRRQAIKETTHPSAVRRMRRRLRNWIGMVRDALVQAVSLIIGTAKTRAPGAAVLSSQEQQLKSLSSEIVGQAGNAYDPLLEKHLFSQVVVEVTTGGETRSYCGYLKDYSSQFVEIVDAFANPRGMSAPVEPYGVGDGRQAGLDVSVTDGRLRIANEGPLVLYVERVEAGSWMRPMGAVVPPGYAADLTLPSSADAETVRTHLGTAERIDMVVPRTHALVRHAAHRSRSEDGGENSGNAAKMRSRKRKSDSRSSSSDDEKSSAPRQVSAQDIFTREE
jgi:hypothetical protein